MKVVVTSRRNSRRAGLGVSLVVHLGLLTVLFGWTHQPWQPRGTLSAIHVASGFSRGLDASREGPAREVRVVDTPAQITGDLVEAKIDNIVARVQELPRPKQLDRLEQMSQQLSRVSNEQSVQELADKFEHWLGYQPRASQPLQESTLQEFDYQTAQLHDVLREGEEGQPPRYTAVLLDAQGRTLRLTMNQTEGEPAYQLMQRIKANPLLDRIYRKIAMPLLDQILRAGRAAAELESDAQEHPAAKSD